HCVAVPPRRLARPGSPAPRSPLRHPLPSSVVVTVPLMEHDERLTVPWWGWLLTLAVTAALSVPFGLGAPIPVVRWLAFAATPVVAVALWWLGRIRVVVTPEELLVDDARLPRRFIAKAVPLDAAGKAALLGPRAE